jgi:hypothetical protein
MRGTEHEAAYFPVINGHTLRASVDALSGSG